MDTKQIRQSVARIGRRVSAPIGSATAALRMTPDFLIVGAQRAGTTSLYKYLAAHPDVGRVRLGKGVHYFDTNFDKSFAWYRAHFPLDGSRLPLIEGVRSVGEGSPYYMFHPECPKRIDALLPGVKVIAILRDPIERAHSQWVHETSRGFETLAFAEALDAETERLRDTESLLVERGGTSFEHQHHSYVARGQYADQVQRLWDVFGRDRVLVIASPRMFSDPAAVYAETLEFLGLPDYTAEYEVHNAHSYSKIEPDIEARLVERFADSNQRLVTMLGDDFDFRRG